MVIGMCHHDWLIIDKIRFTKYLCIGANLFTKIEIGSFLTCEMKFIAFLKIAETINVHEGVYDIDRQIITHGSLYKCYFTIRDLVCCLNSTNAIENYEGKEDKWLALLFLPWFLCGSISCQAQTMTSIYLLTFNFWWIICLDHSALFMSSEWNYSDTVIGIKILYIPLWY